MERHIVLGVLAGWTVACDSTGKAILHRPGTGRSLRFRSLGKALAYAFAEGRRR